jgi:hypothetical protein
VAKLPHFSHSTQLPGQKVSNICELGLSCELYCSLAVAVRVSHISSFLDQDLAELEVSPTGSVVKWRLASQVIHVVYTF